MSIFALLCKFLYHSPPLFPELKDQSNETLRTYSTFCIYPMQNTQGWAMASVLFKRTQRSHILLRSSQKNETFLRSLAFFIKRMLRSLRSFNKKNAAFFAFFYILYKRTLRSFTFFIKERCVLLRSL